MKETVIKIIDFFSKNLKWILMAIIAILIFTTARNCSKYKAEKEESLRLENNLLALNDTLKNYKDGIYNLAKMRALQLRIDELADSLKLERGKAPITIIKYVTVVNDTFQAPVTIIHDTLWFDVGINISDAGIIYSHEHTLFEKSSTSKRNNRSSGIEPKIKCQSPRSFVFSDQSNSFRISSILVYASVS